MKYIIYECDGCGETFQLSAEKLRDKSRPLTKVSIGSVKLELCDKCNAGLKAFLDGWRDEVIDKPVDVVEEFLEGAPLTDE